MSKCSVRRTRTSKFRYWTLLRPKYWAPAGGASAPRANAVNASADHHALRVDTRIGSASGWIVGDRVGARSIEQRTHPWARIIRLGRLRGSESFQRSRVGGQAGVN